MCANLVAGPIGSIPMCRVELITTLDDSIVQRMAELQEHLLKGKHGRPLDAQLFQECIDTGFLVGAYLDYAAHVTDGHPVEERVLAGMCFLFIQQTISRRVMVYEELVVDPQYRGMKIADRIDEFLIQLAKERRCDCIEGTLPVGNEAVRKVHLRNGFSFRDQLPFRLILHQF